MTAAESSATCGRGPREGASAPTGAAGLLPNLLLLILVLVLVLVLLLPPVLLVVLVVLLLMLLLRRSIVRPLRGSE